MIFPIPTFSDLSPHYETARQRARHACNVWRKLVLCRGTLCGSCQVGHALVDSSREGIGRHGKAKRFIADHELRASDGMALSGDLRDWSRLT